MRAEIVDRNGLVLATNMRVPGVHADPSLLADKAAAARQLAAILPGVDASRPAAAPRKRPAFRLGQASHHARGTGRRCWSWACPASASAWREHRVYPKEQLASHVTGFVDIDGRGLSRHRALFRRPAAAGGEPVALSLDLRIQQIVREELADAHRRFRAIGANAMVLDRTTGELLAMVSLPDFDPNRVGDARKIEYLNRNTGGVYELGSVFKILTIAAALDSGQVSLGDKFDATGKLQIGRYRIGDDHAKNRWLSVPEIFEYSSNIGAARMAFAAGGGPLLEKLLSPGGLLRAGRRSRSPRSVRSRTPKRWPDVTVATSRLRPWHRGDAAAVPGRRRRPGRRRDACAHDPAQAGGHGRAAAYTLCRRAHRGHDALADVAGGRAGHGDARQARQLPDRRQDRHGREGRRAGGYSGNKVLASFLGAFPIDASALPGVGVAGRAAGRRQQSRPAGRRLDGGPGRRVDHRPDRPDPGRATDAARCRRADAGQVGRFPAGGVGAVFRAGG